MENGKLIVKNFGPIKEAKIDLKQVMLFIGPQGAGKSSLLKLIGAILRCANETSVYTSDEITLERTFGLILKDDFDLIDLFNPDTYFYFKAYQHEWEFKFGRLKPLSTIDQDAKINSSPIYIPAERSFFAAFEKAIYSLLDGKFNIPPVLRKFGNEWKISIESIRQLSIDFLGVVYKLTNDRSRIFFNKKESVEFSKSASGIQSAALVCLTIENISRKFIAIDSIVNHYARSEHDAAYELMKKTGIISSILIEEPELNLFPTAQKGLVEFMTSRLIQHHRKPHSLIVATHSPYILTAFDNLIQAGNTYKKHPELKKKIEKIIPEECWIDFENVSAYYMEPGKPVKSILDKKNRLIGANKIDKVSEEISIQFHDLLDLELSEKK